MSAAPLLLDLAGFRARTLMPAADVDVAAGMSWRKAGDDAAASAILGEQYAGQVVATGTIAGVVFRPRIGLAADLTNYATLTLSKRTGAGSPIVVAEVETTTIDWTAGLPVVVPIIAGDVTQGDALTVQITKAGAGVIIPSGVLAIIPSPSWIDFALARIQAGIYARLRKRYRIPFDASSPPEKMLDWMTVITTVEAYRKRGTNPADPAIKDFVDDRTSAWAEIKEAADSEAGLFDLPLLADETTSAIVEGGPYGYTEHLPHTWTDKQVTDAEENGEDIDGALT